MLNESTQGIGQRAAPAKAQILFGHLSSESDPPASGDDDYANIHESGFRAPNAKVKRVSVRPAKASSKIDTWHALISRIPQAQRRMVAVRARSMLSSVVHLTELPYNEAIENMHKK